jgi:DNA invertase Pin-like site-specific DNA recombinase
LPILIFQHIGVALALGHSHYNPTDPMGKMFFNILATFAEFEADLIRLRTREGMAVARAKGKLRNSQSYRTSSRRSYAECRVPANIRSAIWRSCFLSLGQRSTGRSFVPHNHNCLASSTLSGQELLLSPVT